MFASIAFYIWPVVVTVFFAIWSRPLALILAILAGYLFLPEISGLNLPLLPTLNKTTIPALTAFLILLLADPGDDGEARRGWVPTHPGPRVLIAMLLVGAILTALTNDKPLIYGSRVLPRLTFRDGLSTIMLTGAALLPLFLGRKLLARPDQQRLLLVTLAIAGCVYSFLALYEIRMSPQLNLIVYDFFPHQWRQHLRDGGYRPIVFLHHGLWLAVFFSMVVLAAFGAARLFLETKKTALFVAGLWLLLTLALSNSFGALAVNLLLVPAVLFLGPHRQLFVAALVACVVLTYPALRSADLVPVDRIHEITQRIDPDRALSLNFRLINEDQFLDKAQQKPLFGWGGYGRNEVFSEAGENLSVPDGYWVLAISKGGWIQYLGTFGLLCLPIILGWYRARRYELGVETSVLALVLTANLIDLIPNATLTPVTWLIAGSLWGRLELGKISEADTGAPEAAQAPPLGSVYARSHEAAERPGGRFTRRRPKKSSTSPRARNNTQ